MNRVTFFIPALIVFALFCSAAASENVVTLKIGPTWPRVLLGSEKATAWDASIMAGKAIDDKFTIGGGLDFLWNNRSSEIPEGANTYRLEMSEHSFMFPLSAYLAVTPFPDLIVYPCLSGQIGLNMMYFSHQEDSTNTTGANPSKDQLQKNNGFYLGFFWKIAADALFNIGEHSAVFAGLEYQHSNPKKVSNNDKSDLFTKRNMSGIGIRMGFRFIY